MEHLSGSCIGYIDPGTGAVLAGTVLPWLLGIIGALLAALAYPFRLVWRWLRRRYYGVLPARVVLLGCDGMDAQLAERWMDEGLLPNLAALRAAGGYRQLPTSIPPESPVAWSAFLTGADAGTHGVSDFLVPDFATYRPRLTTGAVESVGSFFLAGSWRLPLGGARVTGQRHGEPFYRPLARRGVRVTMLRQPLAFPTGREGGARVLASLGVTDVRGRQGDYRLVCAGAPPRDMPADKVIAVTPVDGRAGVTLEGPLRADGQPATVALQLQVAGDTLTISWDGGSAVLRAGEWSALQELRFRVGRCATVPALVDFCAVSLQPLRLFISPLMPHPRYPVLPIVAPHGFGAELFRRHHLFHTLGMAEPLDAVKDGALPPDAFLALAKHIREEREAMLLGELAEQRDGLLSMVFDVPDRVQHLFWRAMETADATAGKVILRSYQALDAFVGQVQRQLRADDTLLVFSDHGFAPFRRAFHLNRWLVDAGYLVAPASERFFRGADWAASRAYGLGFCGLYLNRQGREAQGCVSDGEATALAREIREKLLALTDPDTGGRPVANVYLATDTYLQPGAQTPDLIVGCARGWRIASQSALGGVSDGLFSDNHSRWSGDHCIDAAAVPGVLFSNRALPDGLTLQQLGAHISRHFFRKP